MQSLKAAFFCYQKGEITKIPCKSCLFFLYKRDLENQNHVIL